ncbi:MAG: SPOR domain-containing protein [Desulfomonilaceae bacterium]|nr:SPOR domain-containing protein [Desulfomonilaceae bacterium]
MVFRNTFRTRPREAARSVAKRKDSGDETSPKNGRLTLAVAAALIVMFALVAVNIRLLRDPSVTGRAFGPSVPSRPETSVTPAGSESASGAKKERCYVPPQVTFYRQLTTVDETRQDSPENSEDVPPAAVQGAFFQEATSSGPGDRGKGDPPSVVGMSTEVPDRTVSSRSLNLPQAAPGKKRYTVQVGAFTNPGIAKQWALKWKARGYMVTLKPVARPRTGVIYRLYLGSFSSENEADELVNRLKSREGISALRLLVRN